MNFSTRNPTVVIYVPVQAAGYYSMYEDCMCPGCDPDATIAMGCDMNDWADEVVRVRTPRVVAGDRSWRGYAAA